MALYDSSRTFLYDHSGSRLLPYSVEKDFSKRILPVKIRRRYMCIHYWCKDRARAEHLFKLLEPMRRYSKVRLHNTCVYAVKTLDPQFYKI